MKLITTATSTTLLSLLFLCRTRETSATNIPEASVLQHWSAGLNDGLDLQLIGKICALDSDCESETPVVTRQIDESIDQSLSAAFATPAGRQRSRELLQSDADFQAFEAEERSERQADLCALAQADNSLVSQAAVDCVCGNSPEDTFVYCEAILEQEFQQFHELRTQQRRLKRSLRGQGRELAAGCSIECNIGGQDCGSFADPDENKLDFVLNVIGGAALATEGGSITGSCSVPLRPLPLDATLDVTASFGGIDLATQQITRDGAVDTYASVTAGVCLPGANDPGLDFVYDILEFFGIPSCPLQLTGTVYPLLGTFEASIRATVSIFYAQFEIEALFDETVRNNLQLCEDVSTCTKTENRDCAMCQGDTYASGSIGIRFLFFDWRWDIFDTSAVDSCASGEAGQCSSGLGQATGMADGEFCLAGTTCNNCENGYSWWIGKGSTYCGQEPCWADGTFCLAGTTCNECCNPARDGLGTICGGELWADGTLCGVGTTCNLCANGHSWWVGAGFTRCGYEPCWEDGTVCLAGTTCNECCNTARDGLGTICGGEPWADGTLCGVGTTCNFCANGHSWWVGAGFTRCGHEPCWEDGTVCLAGTTCNECCNTARDALGTKCGGEAWKDGTLCGVGTTCNFCANGHSWWVGAGFTRCGREPCWGRGTICGAGTTCNSCCRGANCPWYQFGICNCR